MRSLRFAVSCWGLSCLLGCAIACALGHRRGNCRAVYRVNFLPNYAGRDAEAGWLCLRGWILRFLLRSQWYRLLHSRHEDICCILWVLVCGQLVILERCSVPSPQLSRVMRWSQGVSCVVKLCRTLRRWSGGKAAPAGMLGLPLFPPRPLPLLHRSHYQILPHHHLGPACERACRLSAHAFCCRAWFLAASVPFEFAPDHQRSLLCCSLGKCSLAIAVLAELTPQASFLRGIFPRTCQRGPVAQCSLPGGQSWAMLVWFAWAVLGGSVPSTMYAAHSHACAEGCHACVRLHIRAAARWCDCGHVQGQRTEGFWFATSLLLRVFEG